VTVSDIAEWHTNDYFEANVKNKP